MLQYGVLRSVSRTREPYHESINLAPSPFSSRASAFYSLSCEGVSEWFCKIGLDVYGDLVTQNLLTGEVLAGMVSRQGNVDFVVS